MLLYSIHQKQYQKKSNTQNLKKNPGIENDKKKKCKLREDMKKELPKD